MSYVVSVHNILEKLYHMDGIYRKELSFVEGMDAQDKAHIEESIRSKIILVEHLINFITLGEIEE